MRLLTLRPAARSRLFLSSPSSSSPSLLLHLFPPSSPSSFSTNTNPNIRWPSKPTQPTEGINSTTFTPLWEATINAHVRGQYKDALTHAHACVEIAAGGTRGTLGREHALRMAHQMTGILCLRLGKIEEAIRSLERAKEVAIRVSGAGGGDDAYVELGSVLNDLGVARALGGDLEEGGQKNISRTMYMAERAYRPDDDLVAAACSNLAEVLCMRGAVEEAVEMAEKAVRLTDKMERLSLLKRSEDGGKEDGDSATRGGGSGGSGGGGAAGGCNTTGTTTTDGKHGAIWQLPAELLALHERSILRRLNLGRTLVRYHRPEEGTYYLFEALQESRVSGLRLNPCLYAQCLATVGATQVASLLHQGKLIDMGHLAKAGCREDNEMTWAPQGLLERALAVLAPVLGEGHPETVACKGNLALLLPLERGLEVLKEEINAGGGGGGGDGGGAGLGREKKEEGGGGGKGSTRGGGADYLLDGASPPLSSSSSTTTTSSHPSHLPLALIRNQDALQSFLIAIGRKEGQAHCAADLMAAAVAKKGGGGGGGGVSVSVSEMETKPEVLWTVNGVLGVGLKGWREGEEEEASPSSSS